MPGAQASMASSRISGLAMWSRTKRWLREGARQLDRGGELSRVDEDVVGEVERCEGGDAALEVGAEHEAVVGLVLHDVADAAQLPVRGEAARADRSTSGARGRPSRRRRG